MQGYKSFTILGYMKKINTIFDVKKCIFCEKEKFRISKKHLYEIKNSNFPIRLMNYIPFLIKIRDSITDPNDYHIISKWHTVLGKLNKNILINNRIKKLK